MDKRAGLAGGLVGFVLGAVACGAAFSLFAPSGAAAPETVRRVEAPAPGREVKSYSQRIILAAVKAEEIDDAIATMGLPNVEQQRVRDDLAEGKYRLVWITLWDWDASRDTGDTISINSDAYHRLFTLHNHRTRIAIPEPKRGYIELRGEQTEDGVIAISLLSGAQPLALPRMTLGQSIKVEIDAP